MPDLSDTFRRLAAECLLLARNARDASDRATHLAMAQTWYELANSHPAKIDPLLRSFNDRQITAPVQQQQQIQSKKDE